MAISLEVPMTAYKRGGTALVSSHKKTEQFNQKNTKRKAITTNPFSPKQVGVSQRNIKGERKVKSNFTYKDHIEDPVLPDSRIQCSRKHQSIQ